MITLFHAPQSRSSRFVWLLEELGIPYEISPVSIRRRDGTLADPSKKSAHPHGKVPAILHDGALVYESSAVALYLTDAFPEAGIGVPIGDSARGSYLSWLAYYTGVMEPAFITKLMGLTTTNGTTGWVSPDEVLAHIHATLEKGPYLVGDRFTSVDVLFGSTFALFRGSPLLQASPAVDAYIERLTARPAYARAAAKDGTPT